MSLPTGTVTFLRTDVEGSMELSRALGREWDAINERHHACIGDAVERHNGVVVRTEGDAVFAVFPEAGAAVGAAVAAERALAAEPWPSGTPIRVRMGLHSGEAHLAGDDYGGFDVSRAARIASVGHGGQVILSGTTQALVASSLPPGVIARDLGLFVLKDIPAPERLYQLDIPGERTDFPPLRVAQATVGNLPERLTTFVGRSAELAELDGLLETSRLITLTGPGGIGKTSLAIELVRGRAETVPDGAWFVPLDSVIDAGLVGSVIARTLGLFDGADRPAVEALPRFLAERSLLLVLDNFEHVLAASGEVATLVRASPGSRFVVTSRAPLRLGGEQEYPVRPLTIGDGTAATGEATRDPASRLFIDRAGAVRPGWDPGDDGPLVTEICSLVDGLPLGIELAAARVSLLSLRAIHDRLKTRLPLPGQGQRDAPDRQRTLEGTIGWSHDLLSTDEQTALHALAVFEGGFDAQQALPVIGSSDSGDDRLDQLLSLADQSLIARDQGSMADGSLPEASGIRFAMMRTVQDVSLRLLAQGGHEPDVRRRHALAFLGLVEVAAPHLFAAGQRVWLRRLALDHPNIRAALRWAIDSDETDLALRFVGALWRFWQIDGHLTEGATWTEEALAMPGADAPTTVRVHALAAAGGIAYWRGDRARTLEMYRAQRDLAETIGDPAELADGWVNLAAAVFLVGDATEALRCATEAQRIFREIGDARGSNRADWGLANLEMMIEGPMPALDLMAQVLERATELGDAPYVALAEGSMAWLAYAMGDIEPAVRWSLTSMAHTYELGDVASTTISLTIGAVVALEVGRPEDAAVLLGAFEGLSERYGVTPPLALAELITSADPLERARQMIEPEILEAALDRGRRMSLDEAMPLVMSLGQ